MQCTTCKGSELKPIELEEKFIAAACQSCEGVFIPLLNYRFWLDSFDSELEIKPIPDGSIEDNTQARLCSKCSGLMIKYKMDLDNENKLDYCASCDYVWLDQGEWELLKSNGLAESLHEITTESYQKSLRDEAQFQREEAYYHELIGKEAFDRLLDFKIWLNNHPEKEAMKVYLFKADDQMV